ncbi:MAG: AI-2E family transporter [Rubrivivax sp.]
MNKIARRVVGLRWWPLVALLVLVWLAWQIRQPLLLFFGAVLVAVTLNVLALPLRRLGLGQRSAVLLASLACVAVVALVVWQLGKPLSEQLQGLRVAVPQAWQAFHAWLATTALGPQMVDWWNGFAQNMELPLAGIAGAATGLVGAVAGIGLVLLAGVFLAMDVGMHRNGLVRLVPVRHRTRIEQVLDASGADLSRWLLGQGVLMLVMGLAVAIGLSLLDMPLALGLGLIAGLLEFVPFVGPIVSGLLAVLVAFAQGPVQAAYVALLFIALQQIEGALLVPLIQRWTVALPPLLGLGAVLVFSTLFGPLGVLLGTPLIMVIVVWVRMLYIDDMLEARAD